MKKRGISFILALVVVLCLSLLPGTALATGDAEHHGACASRQYYRPEL